MPYTTIRHTNPPVTIYYDGRNACPIRQVVYRKIRTVTRGKNRGNFIIWRKRRIAVQIGVDGQWSSIANVPMSVYGRKAA